MSSRDGYLAYLPPVLWPGEQPLLGKLLKGFQKVLSGLDDSVAIEHSVDGKVHTHRGVGPTIDSLADLLSPEWTEKRFLEWLAGWLGLELQSGWDERQQRTAIAEMVRIYAHRGAKDGLARYLDLYAGAAARQRIVIDNGAKILFADLRPDREPAVHALLSQGAHPRPDGTLAYSGLVSPQCVARTPDGHLLVGDAGGPGDKPPGPGVWRITRSGDYADHTEGPARTPAPLGPANWPPATPICLAAAASAGAWQLFVLDVELRLFRMLSTDVHAAQRLTVSPALSIDPAAMIADGGHLLVLDRDGAIVDLDLSTNPVVATTRFVSGLVQPRSLMVTRAGTLIVGDASNQNSATPGDLVTVDRSNPANWVGTSLLTGLATGANPLVAPYAIAEDADGGVLVLDVGLRPDRHGTEPYLRTTIEPAAVYRVHLGSGPSVTSVTGGGQLVFPRGMVLHNGIAYLCDGGDPNDPKVVDGERNFRTAAHEFGVIVHFDKDNTSAEHQRSVVRGIGEIVDRERPASTLPTYLDAIGAG
ncbi:phage tail protein [Actinocrispum sp. NPDC049592]|uniref:phage tail protein n=1 Tax=Actinocrispum sp. NPDC049592 TaxID=3154835 RepID=UPI0034264B70